MKLTKSDLELLFKEEISKLNTQISYVESRIGERRKTINTIQGIIDRLKEINEEAIINRD